MTGRLIRVECFPSSLHVDKDQKMTTVNFISTAAYISTQNSCSLYRMYERFSYSTQIDLSLVSVHTKAICSMHIFTNRILPVFAQQVTEPKSPVLGTGNAQYCPIISHTGVYK